MKFGNVDTGGGDVNAASEGAKIDKSQRTLSSSGPPWLKISLAALTLAGTLGVASMEMCSKPTETEHQSIGEDT